MVAVADGGDDHDIGFREFARVMTAADLFKMKALQPRPKSTVVDEREQARRDALEHLRPGVMQEELRKIHEQVRSRITAKYGKHSFSSAFKWIDADRTGSITRDEFKEALKQLNLAGVREPILDTLCDFIDQDNSGSFGYSEFARVLSAGMFVYTGLFEFAPPITDDQKQNLYLLLAFSAGVGLAYSTELCEDLIYHAVGGGDTL